MGGIGGLGGIGGPGLRRRILTGPEELRAALLQLTRAWVRVVYTGPLAALRKLVNAESEHPPDLQERWFTNGPGSRTGRTSRPSSTAGSRRPWTSSCGPTHHADEFR